MRDIIEAFVPPIFVLGLLLAAVVGYVLNLVAIAHWAGGVGMLVLRVLGVILAPLGAVLGFVS